MDWLFPDVKYPCNEHNVSCKKNRNVIVNHVKISLNYIRTANYIIFKLYPHSKMVQNSLSILISITEIVLYSYSSVSLMIFIWSSSKIVFYSSVVQFSDSTPFSASGFFVYQLKEQEIYDTLY